MRDWIVPASCRPRWRASGIAAPRDADMQETALGNGLRSRSVRALRGDIVFWNGHVGIMLDANASLHANAFHMQVEIETLQQAMARIRRRPAR